MRAKTLTFWILMLLILFIGAILFLTATPHGVGLVSDSVLYINGARSIAEGHGYFRDTGGGQTKPITNFPPLYSIILAVPIYFGVNALQAARWVSLIFYLFNLLLSGYLIRWITKSFLLGIIAAILFLATKPFLYFQVFAMAEPVFFFCTLSAFLLLLHAYEKKNLRWLFVCGIVCGLALLTRYVGAVSLCAVLLTVLFFFDGKRLKSVALVLAGAVPVAGSWFIRNMIVSGNVANRQILPHWLSSQDLNTGVLIFWRWLVPNRYETVYSAQPWMQLGVLAFGLASVLFLLGCLLYMWRKRRNLSADMVLLWAIVLYILGYIAMVVLTISLFDASVNIEERILYPAIMLILWIPLILIGRLMRWKYRLSVCLCVFAYTFFIGLLALQTAVFLPRFAENGYGWAWGGWNTSPAMQIIRNLDSDLVLYTNQPEAVSLWTERGAYALLDPIDPSSNMQRNGYDQVMQNIRTQVLSGNAVLIFFGIQDWLGDTGDNWVTDLCRDLPVIYQDESEWVLGINPVDMQ